MIQFTVSITLLIGRRFVKRKIGLALMLSVTILENIQIVHHVIGYARIALMHLELVHVIQLSADHVSIRCSANTVRREFLIGAL